MSSAGTMSMWRYRPFVTSLSSTLRTFVCGTLPAKWSKWRVDYSYVRGHHWQAVVTKVLFFWGGGAYCGTCEATFYPRKHIKVKQMLKWSWQCINISWSLFYLNAFFFFLPCMLMAVFKSVDCIKRWDEASALKRRSDKNLRSFVWASRGRQIRLQKRLTMIGRQRVQMGIQPMDGVTTTLSILTHSRGQISTQWTHRGPSWVNHNNEWILAGHEQYLSTRLNCGLSDTFPMRLLECGVVYMCALAGCHCESHLLWVTCTKKSSK